MLSDYLSPPITAPLISAFWDTEGPGVCRLIDTLQTIQPLKENITHETRVIPHDMHARTCFGHLQRACGCLYCQYIAIILSLFLNSHAIKITSDYMCSSKTIFFV